VKYQIKKVVEEVDVLSLSQEEYNKLNDFYYEIISNRFPQLARDKQIYNITRVILTDDLSRAEVVIAVEGKEPEMIKTPGYASTSRTQQ
jgi:hypothetical protein